MKLKNIFHILSVFVLCLYQILEIITCSHTNLVSYFTRFSQIFVMSYIYFKIQIDVFDYVFENTNLVGVSGSQDWETNPPLN